MDVVKAIGERDHFTFKYCINPHLENVPKGAGDKPAEKVVIADSGEVSKSDAFISSFANPVFYSLRSSMKLMPRATRCLSTWSFKRHDPKMTNPKRAFFALFFFSDSRRGTPTAVRTNTHRPVRHWC